MKVKFLQPRGLGGVDYTVGIHEVPDSFATHWFLLAAVTNGAAMVVEAPKGVVAQVPAKPIVEDELKDEAVEAIEPKAKKKKKASAQEE